MFAKIDLVFKIVGENSDSITLRSREDDKEFTISKGSPIHKTLKRSFTLNEEINMITSTEMCGIIDEISRNDLFYAEFKKKENGENRMIHCRKIGYLPDGRVKVIDLELKEFRTFYKRDVINVSCYGKSYQVK